MSAIVLSIPTRRAAWRLFQHPPPRELSGPSGATVRLTVPPMHGVEIELGPLTREESAKLGGELASARNAEVLVQVPDAASAYTGGGLTVASVSGLTLTLNGWVGTWQEGKRLSITRAGRRYLVPTTGVITAGAVTMAATPRVTFQSGDAVAYNAVMLQGLLMNAEQVLESIGTRGVSEGLKLVVREIV